MLKQCQCSFGAHCGRSAVDAHDTTIMPPNKKQKHQYKRLTLEEALSCKKCGAVARLIEEADVDGGYTEGECILINCPNAGCRKWCHCRTCWKSFSRSNLCVHPTGKIHVDLHAAIYGENNADDINGNIMDICLPTSHNNDADDASLAEMETDELREWHHVLRAGVKLSSQNDST